jgi:polysaccharide chain length determinant protein (PEP-CTERM system associated)
MQELLSQAAAHVRGMWRYRWYGVLVAWIVAAIGVVTVMRIPDQYEATARIYVDTQSILQPLMSGLAVQPDVEQQIVMLSRTLLSRPNLEKLVRMADLDLKKSSVARQDQVLDELSEKLSLRSAARDNLYAVSYRHEDPEAAKRVVQALVSIFVESGLGANRKDNDTARVFINEQIKSYLSKLEEAEARLKAFRIRNLDLQSPDGKDSASRLSELSAQLDRARLELREAENARDAAKAAIEQERTNDKGSALPDLLQGAEAQIATPEIDARLDAQRRALDGLLQRYTDRHPDVLSARRLIGELEEQKRKEMAELRRTAVAAPSGPSAANTSLALQELNRMLAMSEVQAASLKARVAEFSSRYQQARAALKTAPQIEAEAAQLNRDYEVHKRNYDDLVKRRESAAISGDLEVASGLAEFRLIDPPRASPRPVAPNRLMLMPLALLAALVAGVVVPFALSELRPVFHQAADLRNRVGLPLLGIVSRVVSDADRRRERLDAARFWFASASLVGLFAVGLTTMSLLPYR